MQMQFLQRWPVGHRFIGGQYDFIRAADNYHVTRNEVARGLDGAGHGGPARRAWSCRRCSSEKLGVARYGNGYINNCCTINTLSIASHIKRAKQSEVILFTMH